VATLRIRTSVPPGPGLVASSADTELRRRHLGTGLPPYSVDEAAAVTGLSWDLLYDQMRTRKLGHLEIGRRRIITREHLAAFLALRSA
jgi:excisionase family DNA binding protein